MTDYIKREDAIRAVYEMHVGGVAAVKTALPNTYGEDLREIVEEIEAIPAADVRPNVRGEWIVHMNELFPADSTIECDQCHEVQTAFISDSFCPNCGADMRGEDK